MRNAFLSDRTAADIDASVLKILRGLGNPEPPLELELVRGLQKLDRQYYSSGDDSVTREFVHKLKMAGKQLVLRPTLIWDVVKKFDLKALYLPDRKRILIDSTLPSIKQRWGEAHEIGHSLIEWHELYMLGDDKLSLSPGCHAQLEAEANYAAARLLFLRDRIVDELDSSAPSLKVVQTVGNTFGNSMTTTLCGMVEHLKVPAIGLVTDHPIRRAAAAKSGEPCRYFIRSRMFEGQFGKLSEVELFAVVQSYCGFRTRGPLGEDEVVLTDDNGRPHIFFLETFFNGHDALTLGVYRAPKQIIIPSSTVSAV